MTTEPMADGLPPTDSHLRNLRQLRNRWQRHARELNEYVNPDPGDIVQVLTQPEREVMRAVVERCEIAVTMYEEKIEAEQQRLLSVPIQIGGFTLFRNRIYNVTLKDQWSGRTQRTYRNLRIVACMTRWRIGDMTVIMESVNSASRRPRRHDIHDSVLVDVQDVGAWEGRYEG